MAVHENMAVNSGGSAHQIVVNFSFGPLTNMDGKRDIASLFLRQPASRTIIYLRRFLQVC